MQKNLEKSIPSGGRSPKKGLNTDSLSASARVNYNSRSHKIQKNLLDDFYKSIPQALAVYDANFNIVYVNDAFLNLYGYSRNNITRLTLYDLHSTCEKPAAVEGIYRKLQKSKSAVVSCHLKKNGICVRAELRVTSLKIQKENLFVLYINDVTEVLKSEEEKKLSAEINEAIAKGKTFKDSLEKALQKIRTWLNCEVGEFWLFSEENEYALIEAFSVARNQPLIKNFVESSLMLRVTKQQILKSKSYAAMKPLWIPDLRESQVLMRGAEALAAGLKSAVTLPILDQDKLAGGIFLFSTEVRQLDQAKLNMLASCMHQLNAEIKHRRSYDQLQSFFELSRDLMCIGDVSGVFRKINPAFKELLGYSDRDVIGRTFLEFIHEEDVDKTKKALSDILRQKKLKEFSHRFRSKNGEYKWLSWSVTFSKDQQLLLAAARDITERKKVSAELKQTMTKLQESDERYAAFLEHSSEAIWRIEAPGGISINKSFEEIIAYFDKHAYLAECNKSFSGMYGYPDPQEMVGMRLSEIMSMDDANNLAYFSAFVSSGFNLTDAESVEFDKNGQVKYILNNLLGIVEGEKLIRVWGTQRDITSLKLAEKEIQLREEQYRTLSENVPVMIFRVNKDYRFSYVNKAVKDMFNFLPDSFIGKTPHELGLEERQWKSLRSKSDGVFQEGKSESFTFKLPSLTAPGKEYNLLINLTPEKNESGEVISLIAIANEITPIIRAQEELIYKDKLLSVTADAAYNLLKEDNYSSILDSILRNLGIATSADRVYIFENIRNKKGELVSSQTHEWCAPDCEPQADNPDNQEMPINFIVEQLEENLAEGTVFARITDEIKNDELRALLASQQIKSIVIAPIFVDAEFWGFVGLDACSSQRVWGEMDKSILKTFASSLASAIERKKGQEAIVESEARFRQMADNAPVMIWLSDQNNKTVYVNSSWIDFTGISLKQLNNKDGWFTLVHPDDRHIGINEYDEKFSRRSPVQIEYRLKTKDGSFRWVIDHAIPRTLADGSFLGYIGSVIDIHDRKLSEEKISYQAQVLQEVSEAIISTDLDYKVVTWNKGAEKMYGIPAGQILGKCLNDYVNHKYVNESQDQAVIRLNKYGYWTGELCFDRHDGKQVYMHASLSFVNNKEGNRVGIAGIHRDITEKRKSEQALRISEERYRTVVDALGEGIVLQDPDGKVITSNSSAQTILGLNADDLRGRSSLAASWKNIHEDGSLFPGHDHPGVITQRTGKSMQNVVMGILKPDGVLIWISINTEPLYYSEQRNSPDAVVVSFIDITEKKNSEIELKRNEQQLREFSDRIKNILDSITDGFIAVDNEFKVFLWNRVFENTTGISSGEAVGKNIREVFPGLSETVLDRFHTALTSGKSAMDEYYSGMYDMWFETTAFPSMQGLFIYFRNITHRKRQESLLALEKEVLELNAKPQATLKVTTEFLLSGIEKMFRGMSCSVITLHDDGFSIDTLSAPSMPEPYSTTIKGLQIGPKEGSCGTAMYLKQNVIVDNIATSELWEKYKDLALEFNLHSCWSYPILSSQNRVLASFAVYHNEVKSPTAEELLVIDRTINILRIIIENKQAEEKIKVSNERYLLATMATNDAIWDWDVFTNNMYWGEGFHALFGYKAGYFSNDLGIWESSIHPRDRERVLDSIKSFVETNRQEVWQEEYLFRKANGNYLLVSDRGFLIYNQNGKVSRMVGSMQDITEKREMEKQLLKQELDKQKLIAQAVVEAQEKERSLIGKELHDNVNQILSTAKLYLELARTDEKEREALIDMSTHNISDAINEIRSISRSLVPSSIGDLGLVESLQDLVESIKLTRKLTVEFFYHDGIDGLMSEQQKLMLFRITQEQVNNVMKHANASNLVIALTTDEEAISITITDDGRGFDADQVRHKKGVGLSNIASRAELFNGTVNLDTAPGKGCSLNILIPKYISN